VEAELSTNDPKPPFAAQPQAMPGMTDLMKPRPDHGEHTYKGTGRLQDRKAIITGGDSGIGRAVAIAYAREGADVLISYLPEEQADAEQVREMIEAAGRSAVLVPGDISQAEHCRTLVARAVQEFGRVDILVNNAAHQDTFRSIDEISDAEWEFTFAVNIHAMFYLTKAVVPHMKPGSSIINTTSVQADDPSQELLAYASTKGAIQNFTGGLAQMLAEKGIRANCVAPGPIWTPLIPATMFEEKVTSFGEQVPMKRPGQPRELAPVYVLLASDEASYISGATVAVTGGKPII
jgi:NAD(P)-dependent dehydrogenase (short-subunit alcohol dehydrogenase family)